MYIKIIKILSQAGTLAALTAAQTALWVPDCGDHVLMLGDRIAHEFQGLNAGSVTNIDTVLAFRTYTVLHQSTAPAGFKYTGDYLVKDPLLTHTITTCTTEASSTGATGIPAVTSPVSAQAPVGTSKLTMSLQSTSVEVAPTSCFTTGVPETDMLFVLSQVMEFCGSHTSLASPTSISAMSTKGDRQVQFDVGEAECNTGPGAASDIPFSVGIPTGPRPTDSFGVWNAAIAPCMQLSNIWQHCIYEQDNGGRGGYGTFGCLQLSLKFKQGTQSD
ncbi:kynurenine 3-monooxygenase [Cordyceps javanica]|uniref:Kynurenine 3-monooxygenase n=1 Tax=Cordyceps javanica TaxID=43265 RepID=A0A545VJ33_9HYPO|nr:kynurenine 3-monooxygenase [Cordyceps javanica]TQW01742.1 kynurenine 3-monooxygenase [Cordyceps javanica]